MLRDGVYIGPSYLLELGKLRLKPWADPEGDRRSGPPFLKNHKNIGFMSNTGPDPLKSHKATKPAFNGGRSSTR